jgi:uncharacterized protein (TIGR02996 family)
VSLLIQAPLETEVVAIPSDGNVVPVALFDGLTIGRAPDCAISFAEPWLAPRHARVVRTSDGYFIEAIGNAVMWFGSERITRRRLHVGDIVLASQTPILFQHRLPPPVWWDEAAPLLAAIREEPADDDVRLVFADWLASRDPRRAEFIACQIAAERGSAEAAARAGELLDVSCAAPLATPLERWTMRRGFVDTARILNTASSALLAEHPGCTFSRLDYPPPPFAR